MAFVGKVEEDEVEDVEKLKFPSGEPRRLFGYGLWSQHSTTRLP